MIRIRLELNHLEIIHFHLKDMSVWLSCFSSFFIWQELHVFVIYKSGLCIFIMMLYNSILSSLFALSSKFDLN